MLPTCEVKRGPDHFFKIEHSDQDAIDNWQMIHQISSKTKEDFQTVTIEKDDSVPNKDFEVFCVLFRGIELVFGAPPKKVRSNLHDVFICFYFFSLNRVPE
jgi:hypothetical protein